MRILLTGACGFIGSHLANRLVDLGHEVVGVDNLSNSSENPRKFKFEHIDFRQYVQEWPMDDFDAVFHLAARINVDESIENPEFYFDQNARGTVQLLEALRRSHFVGKVVYASSAEVYGNAQFPYMTEDHPLDPLSPYAASKLSAEQFCKVYAQLYGLDVTVVRNFNTFGAYQRGGIYGGVIAKFKAQAKAGDPLTVYGSGEQRRDYMHISQAVDGYVFAIENKLPQIINFGSGKTHKIIDIANRISKRFQVPITHTKSRPNEIMRLQADIGRATRYGYKMQTDFWRHLDEYLEL